MPVATHHLEEEAQLWHQLLKDDEGQVSWDILKEALHARNCPTHYEDFFGDHTNLKEIGSAQEYQTQVQRLPRGARRMS